LTEQVCSFFVAGFVFLFGELLGEKAVGGRKLGGKWGEGKKSRWKGKKKEGDGGKKKRECIGEQRHMTFINIRRVGDRQGGVRARGEMRRKRKGNA